MIAAIAVLVVRSFVVGLIVVGKCDQFGGLRAIRFWEAIGFLGLEGDRFLGMKCDYYCAIAIFVLGSAIVFWGLKRRSCWGEVSAISAIANSHFVMN